MIPLARAPDDGPTTCGGGFASGLPRFPDGRELRNMPTHLLQTVWNVASGRPEWCCAVMLLAPSMALARAVTAAPGRSRCTSAQFGGAPPIPPCRLRGPT